MCCRNKKQSCQKPENLKDHYEIIRDSDKVITA